MRVFILLLAVLLAIDSAQAFSLKKKEPATPNVISSPFPIDEEFVTDFVEYDVKEAKNLEKQEKAQAKIGQKREKLEAKKVKLEKKRDASIENCERSQVYFEKLKASEENL